ncbi:MAG: Trm112 family protein [Ignisphaera sp.]
MRYATMDIIICPICKFYPLNLRVFKEMKLEIVTVTHRPYCRFFCALHNKYVAELVHVDCEECLSHDIVWGILCCPKCKNYYPIILGVPLMYPQYLRQNQKVRALINIFMRKFRLDPANIVCNT